MWKETINWCNARAFSINKEIYNSLHDKEQSPWFVMQLQREGTMIYTL